MVGALKRMKDVGQDGLQDVKVSIEKGAEVRFTAPVTVCRKSDTANALLTTDRHSLLSHYTRWIRDWHRRTRHAAHAVADGLLYFSRRTQDKGAKERVVGPRGSLPSGAAGVPPRPALQSLHARRFCLLAQPVSVRLPPRAAYTESSILHWRNCISLRDVGLFEVPLKSEDEDGLAVTLSVEWTKCRDLFHASTSAKQLPSTLLFKGRLESSTPDGTGRMLPGPKSSLSRRRSTPNKRASVSSLDSRCVRQAGFALRFDCPRHRRSSSSAS